MIVARVDALAKSLFDEDVWALRVKSDRLFVRLFAAQWAFAVVLALLLSPWSYEGELRRVHPHVWTAMVIGGSLFALARAIVVRHPGGVTTRHVVAATQMLFSALLIHVTGGRIETHFHVFGSLAFVSFYLDWRLLVTAALAVAADHLLRGMMWPASVYGIANPEWWRFLEHASWVAFENIVLVLGIQRSLANVRDLAVRRAALTEINHVIEQQVALRTAELETSREQYRALVEGTQAVPWEFDPAMRCSRYVGPQIESLTGYPARRFEEPDFYLGVIFPADVERVVATMSSAILDGCDFQIELRLVSSAGSLVHVRSIVAVVRDGDAVILRGVTFDISAEKVLEAELREAQKLESLGRMAAGVAHEINTPLQYIGDNVRFLGAATARLLAALKAVDTVRLGDAADGDQGRRLEEIVRRAKLGSLENHVPDAIAATADGLRAVERIVGALQAATRSRPLEGSAPAGTADLVQQVELAVAAARTRWPALQFDIDSSVTRVEVGATAETLGEVLPALLCNAAEASAEVENPGRISVSVRVVAGIAELRVTDRGPGIAPDVRERIFDPFFTTKGVGHGRGVGLHHLRDLVVATPGGALCCEETSAAGTTFLLRVRAPLCDAAAA